MTSENGPRDNIRWDEQPFFLVRGNSLGDPTAPTEDLSETGGRHSDRIDTIELFMLKETPTEDLGSTLPTEPVEAIQPAGPDLEKHARRTQVTATGVETVIGALVPVAAAGTIFAIKKDAGEVAVWGGAMTVALGLITGGIDAARRSAKKELRERSIKTGREKRKEQRAYRRELEKYQPQNFLPKNFSSPLR